MFRRAFLLILLTGAPAFADSEAEIRAQEHPLAEALRTADRTALTSLLDPDFRYSLSYSCAVNRFDIEFAKADWIARITQPPVRSYRVVVARVHSFSLRNPTQSGPAPAAADVTLEENWILASDGRLLHQRFQTSDVWKREEHGWKLIRRYAIATPNPNTPFCAGELDSEP